MVVIADEYVELATPNGPMRTHIVRPAGAGKYPGIIFYSEIFQVTGADSSHSGDAGGAWVCSGGSGDLSRV